MKLRIKLTKKQAEMVSQEISSWEDDTYINVRTLGYPEFWPANVDKEFFKPGDLILINSCGNIAGLRGDELLFSGRRHSLWQAPTISAVFEAADLINRDKDCIEEAGKKAKVLEYESFRTDCPWWAVDLDHPDVAEIESIAKQLSIRL